MLPKNISNFHSISSICGINNNNGNGTNNQHFTAAYMDYDEQQNHQKDHFRAPHNYFLGSTIKTRNRSYEEPSTTTMNLDDSEVSSPSIQDDSDECKVGGGGGSCSTTTNGIGRANSTNNSINHANIECVVCGDKSSGKHYGQYTCEGCKSFFKRSVRRNLTYACRGNHNCPIDIHHRNQCQNCRFQKCIKMGMRKEAVQQGRMPQYSFGSYFTSGLTNSYLHKYYSLFPPNCDPQYIKDKTAFVQKLLFNHPNLIDENINNKYYGIDSIYEVASKILQGVIEWSKNIPFFPELSVMDQITLLKSSWAELFILTAAHYATPLYLAPLLASVGLQATPTGAEKVIVLLDHLRLVQEQIDRLKKFQIDQAEFSCLKALVLFNPDTRGLSDPSHIEYVQETVQNALEEYDKFHYPNQTTRFGKLLLRIPQLKCINSSLLEELLFSRNPNKPSVDNMIKDYIINTLSFSTNNSNQINKEALKSSHFQQNGNSAFSSISNNSNKGYNPLIWSPSQWINAVSNNVSRKQENPAT